MTDGEIDAGASDIGGVKGSGVAGIVFDFDGTILDTETPVYESWRDTFVELNVEPISFEDWVDSIGLAAHKLDPPTELEKRSGRPFDREAVLEMRLKKRSDAVAALPVRDGIVAWLDEARAAGLMLGVASSSPRVWVEEHLDARKLLHYFSAISCAGDRLPDGAGTVPGKPDPTSYRLTAAKLGLDPAECIAVEDSPHGITAANGAGMFTVATPGPMTSHMNFDHASLLLGALSDKTIADVAAIRRG